MDLPHRAGEARRSLRVLAAAWMILILAGCQDGTETPTTFGPALSVAEALMGAEGPVNVRGFIFADDTGTVTLADAMAESFPPQPAGATLTVVGLDLNPFNLESGGGRSWSVEPVEIVGNLQGQTLVVIAQG
ncbi:MAG TPA: hypothetical protein VLA54_03175 [Acidimicrobiia bacterium]|nr:hypothetical protein [Acidimicrobiia bacterium]